MQDCGILTGAGRSATRRAARGFTLIELTIALFLAGVVLSGLGSLVLLGTRAVPDEDGLQAAAISAGDAMERLAGELSVAKSVTDLSATGVTMTLADWTGDGVDEVVRYEWSGTTGEPFVRAVNGAGGAALIPRVGTLAFAWSTGAESESTGAAATLLEDQIVQSVSTVDLFGSSISATSAYAQRVDPALPADAIAWRPRTVALWLAKTGASSADVLVELRSVEDGTLLPGPTVFASQSIPATTLPSSRSRVAITLDCPRLPAGEDVCIVVTTLSASAPATLTFGTSLAALGARYGYSSNDGATTWGAVLLQAVQHTLSADVWTGLDTPRSRTALSGVRATIELGDQPLHLEREISLLNRPEVTP